MIRNCFKIVIIAVALFALSGCSFSYGDDLLVAPRLPEEYKMLQVKLDEISAGGAAFLVAADSGQARQSVQLVDLDGDGEDEAVAFFRAVDGEIRVYVFRRSALGYEQVGMAVGFGPSLHSVQYPGIGGGRLALAIAWGQEGGGYGMTVYALGSESGLYEMLDIQYVGFATHDIDGDGAEEAVFIRRASIMDTAEPRFYAAFFSVKDGIYREFTSADLCKEVRSVTSLTFGNTLNDVPALFIDSQSIGGGYVTDLISLENGQAFNETMDPAAESGKITFRSLSVLSSDINGDGIIDIPTTDMSRAFVPDSPVDTTRGNKLYWKNFALGIDVADVALTYHNVTDKWYIFWPEQWDDTVCAEYSKSSYMQRTRFYVPIFDDQLDEPGETQHNIFSIYVFSGDDRAEHRKMFGTVRHLKTTATHIYCYGISTDQTLGVGLTAEKAESIFRTIDSAWRIES